MANWYGTSRTNFVRVKNVEAAKASLEDFNNTIHTHPLQPDFIMISGDDDGDFSTSALVDLDDGGDEEVELDWAEWAQKHLAEGQVLIMMSAGAEKLRYVSGYAKAYSWMGNELTITLNDIYRAIQDHWAIDMSQVADCTYENLPASMQAESTSD